MSIKLAKIRASADAAKSVFDKTEDKNLDVDADLSDMERVAVMLHTANTIPENVTLLLDIIHRYKFALEEGASPDRVEDDVAQLVDKLKVYP